MLTEQVVLDITRANRQIEDLEAELRRLSQPIRIPVDVTAAGGVDELRRDFASADTSVASLNNELEETERELRRVDRAADDSTDAILRVGTRGASAFTSLRGSILGVGAAFAAIAGARAFLGFANESIQAASAMEESTSKAGVVFGDFFDDINAFASVAPQALGLANQQALEFTATFGNLFTALGLSQEAAARLSPEIVQLGADLASFNNLDVADALEKLRSGLVGEIEPLRSLGVSFNAANVEAKALELGLVGVGGEISEAAKVQARYALILEQTTNAQGDFARTSDSIANRQRTVNAELANLRVAVGEALVPFFETILTTAPVVIDAIESIVPAIAGLSASVGTLDPQGLADFLQVLTAIPDALGVVTEGAGALTNLAGGAAALVRLDFNTAFGEFEAGITGVRTAAENFDIARFRNDLVNALQAGVEPTEALAVALDKLGQTDLQPDRFKEVAKALISMVNLDPAGISTLRTRFRNLAEELGFSTEEARLLRLELDLLAAQTVFSPEAFRIPGLDTGPLINQVGETARIFGELPGIINGSLDRIQFAGSTDALAERFGTALNESFSDALTDESGEIEDDAKQFVDRLINDIEEATQFQLDLQTLRDMGGQLLADYIAGLTPEEGQPLLSDLIDSPAEIARGEDAARNKAMSDFAAYYAQFAEQISAADFSAIPVEPLVVPITFGAFPTLPTAPQLTGAIPGAGTVNVYNEWNTLPSPSVASDQINQSVGTINKKYSLMPTCDDLRLGGTLSGSGITGGTSINNTALGVTDWAPLFGSPGVSTAALEVNGRPGAFFAGDGLGRPRFLNLPMIITRVGPSTECANLWDNTDDFLTLVTSNTYLEVDVEGSSRFLPVRTIDSASFSDWRQSRQISIPLVSGWPYWREGGTQSSDTISGADTLTVLGRKTVYDAVLVFSGAGSFTNTTEGWTITVTAGASPVTVDLGTREVTVGGSPATNRVRRTDRDWGWFTVGANSVSSTVSVAVTWRSQYV